MNKREQIQKNKKKIQELNDEIDALFRDIDDYEKEDYDDYNEQQMFRDPNYIANEIENKKNALKKENRKLRADIEIEEQIKESELLSENYKSGIVLSDKSSDNDLLSREMYANILARHIVKKNVQTPLNIGIFGEWGEGKSSFLNLMESKLNDLNNKDYRHMCESHIVRFNAYEYNEKNKIWSSILSKLFQEFEESEKVCGSIKYACKKICDSFKQNIALYIINIIIIVLTLFWFSSIVKFDGSMSIMIDEGWKIIGVVPSIMFLTNVFIPFIKKQMSILQPISETIISRFKSPNFKNKLGFRENIKSSLDDLLKVWINSEDERIVIFVDELDRCSSATVAEFFDALQLFLSVEGITVVLSVNYKTVCYSLAEHNSHFFNSDVKKREEMEFGIHYLEKYISIPIHLSRNDSYEMFIDEVFDIINGSDKIPNNKVDFNKLFEENNDEDESKKSDLKTFTVSEEDLINKIINWVNKFRYITPREVKNIINTLVIAKDVCVLSNKKALYDENVVFKKFIKWFLFQYFNRNLADRLIEFLNNSKYENASIDELDGEIESIITADDESTILKMFKLLDRIRVEEVMIFKEITQWFIKSYDNMMSN